MSKRRWFGLSKTRKPRQTRRRSLMRMWRVLVSLFAGLLLSQQGATQQHLTIPTQDGAAIAADLYGAGTRGVVLAHGGRRTKADWAPQAEILAAHGFCVLAFDFRGFGESPVPPPALQADEALRFDVLAAVRYLHHHGARTVAVIGASFGGVAAADASVASEPGEIDRLVLLAHGSSRHPELIRGRKLFVVGRDDTDRSGTMPLPGMPPVHST